MNYDEVLRIFRKVAIEFNDIEDDIVKGWIEISSPLVSKRRFRKLWAQALALLTAHRMKMSGIGKDKEDDPLGDLNDINIANMIRVGNVSEGGVSIGLNNNLAQLMENDAEYALTIYGIQFKTLIRMLMSITSAGESRGRP